MLGDSRIEDRMDKRKAGENDVTSWLRSLGLECYADTFVKENIDFSNVQDLSDEDFKELGLTVGHRAKLKKAISNLQSHSLPFSPSPSSSFTKEVTPYSSPFTKEVTPHSSFSSASVQEYACKVIVVGESATGKTSLIQRYTVGTFEKNYKATIGVDFCLKEMIINPHTIVSLQLWDIAGQDRFTNLTRTYYREARGAFVVFDVTKEKTLDAVLKWKQDIDSKVTLPSGKVIPIVLLANKCDLPPFDKSFNLDEFCLTHGFVKGFWTSAKENIGITEASLFLVETILESCELTSNLHESFKGGLRLASNQSKSPSTKKESFCCS